MIKLRVLAGAFLVNGTNVLLMKRAVDSRLFAGYWAAIGGHAEPAEINNPQAACLRELREEAGLEPEEISGLRLSYIVHRRAGDEIRVQYIYFGNVKGRNFLPCDEGEFHWVSLDEAVKLEASFTTQEILKHHINRSVEDQDLVYVGTVGSEKSQPVMTWVPLQDWE